MRKHNYYKFIVIILICLGFSLESLSQCAGWTQKANFLGVGRLGAVGFSIGDKGYVGTGYDGSMQGDFWEYDPLADTWTQKADFGGSPRWKAMGFSVGNKGYLGLGSPQMQDIWEYDPIGNTWVQKGNFGGVGREHPIGFSIGNKGYAGLGANSGELQDFWEYEPLTDTWTQIADYGGSARRGTSVFVIGGKAYVGTGYDGSYINDCWSYDTLSNVWSQIPDFPGSVRWFAIGFSVNGLGYLGTGYSGGEFKDFWEYNPLDSTWTQIADYGNLSAGAISFTIQNTAYVGLGSSSNNSDLWEYGVGLDISSISTISETCNSSDGSITISVVGGVGPVSFSIDSGNTFPDTTGVFTGLSAGTYGVVVLDSLGCSDTNNFVVISQQAGISLSIDSTNDQSCNGSNDGSISLSTTGGIGTISYSIDSGLTYQDTTSFFEGLAPGIYYIMVKDSTGCAQASNVVTLNEPLALSIFSQTSTGITCNGAADGTINIVANGGVGIISYSIDSGSTFLDTSGVFNNLGGGAYYVMIMDSNGCIASGSSISVIEPLAISIVSETSTDITCNGLVDGMITISATGGTGMLSFSIDSGSTFSDTTGFFTDLGAGSYFIIVMDTNGCSLDGSSVTIDEPLALTTSFILSSADSNNSGIGTASMQPTGGVSPYTYTWTPSGQTASTATGLIEGMYLVSVQDSNGCTHMDSVYVSNVNDVGIGDYSSLNGQLLVYPNPSNGKFYISIGDNHVGTIQVALIDLAGSVVHETVFEDASKLVIDASELTKGTYILRVDSETGRAYTKINLLK